MRGTHDSSLPLLVLQRDHQADVLRLSGSGPSSPGLLLSISPSLSHLGLVQVDELLASEVEGRCLVENDQAVSLLSARAGRLRIRREVGRESKKLVDLL